MSVAAAHTELRDVSLEELAESHFSVLASAWLREPQSAEDVAEVLPTQTEKHFLTMFDNGVPAATGASIPMTQNVRGTLVAMGGVSGVAADPRYRRRGYVRRVMTGLLAGMRERNQPVSTLYPFRESFYGRLGYVNFPQERLVRMSTSALEPLLRQAMPGEVALVKVRDGWDRYRAFLSDVQRRTHGMSLRPTANASWTPNRNRHWLAFATAGGEIVGAMLYAPGENHRELQVSDFFYRDSAGKYLLLQWLARHIDQAREMWLNVGPDQMVETWLDDFDVGVHTRRSREDQRDPMGRVVIVEGLAGLRAGPGRFTARIVDEHCPWNAGSYTFEAVNGELSVRRSDEAGCELTIQGLSALVFVGGDPGDFPYRGWGDPDAETRAAMRSMFPPVLPYLHEKF